MTDERGPDPTGSTRVEPEPVRIGVNLTSIGVTAGWWVETAGLLEWAGYRSVWCWDHFVSRGRKTDSVLECWTTLTAAAARTTRIRVGSFVNNVMNRHPAVLARMTATLHEFAAGRVEVGIGIGGNPSELLPYGIDFPEAPERVARLEEAVQVLRLLWSGGPVSFEGRYYRLAGAYAHPAPQPPPRIIVGAVSPGGARLAARIGDGWTTDAVRLDALLPVFEEALAAAGRARRDVGIVAAVDLERDVPAERQPLFADLRGEAERWRERGADEIVLQWIRPRDVPAVLSAAERAGSG